MRSDEFAQGLPDLSPTDQRQVKEGNQLANITAQILGPTYRLGIACCLEIPATSRLWNLTCFVRLLQRPYVHSIHLDLCCYGRPWRKITKVLFAWVTLRSHTNICSSKRGICDITSRPHQVLEGKEPGTQFFLDSHCRALPQAPLHGLVEVF